MTTNAFILLSLMLMTKRESRIYALIGGAAGLSLIRWLFPW